MAELVLQKRYWMMLLMLVVYSVSHGQVFNAVVDQNGSGDYTTVQAALDAVPDNQTERTLIFVKNGTYHEKVVLASTKTNVSLIGEDAMKTIISYDDNADKGMSSADTYTFLAGASGFYAENITFENTSGSAHGQALAIQTTGDMMVFKFCRFLGFQDTYYAHKNRQYNLGCYIEGGTDFIYGDATTVFDYCTVNCLKGGQYITAPADTKLISYPFATGKFLHGLLLRFCDVTANSDVAAGSYYLGRPWQPNASSVYIQCKLGPQVRPAGWATGSGSDHLSSYFAEYHDMNPDGSLTDTTQRVSWSYQVPDANRDYYNLDYFLKKNNAEWDPVPITQELAVPKNLTATESVISWDAVDNAKGYLVLKDDSVIAITETNSYTDPNFDGAAVYAAKSVSVNGNLSKSSNDGTTGIETVKSDKQTLILGQSDGGVRFSGEVQFKVYTLSGAVLQSGSGRSVNLTALPHGIYILKAVDANGSNDTQKIRL